VQVRELPPGYLLSGVKRGAGYAKGLWVRLNGGGRSGNRNEPLPAELPIPVSTKARKRLDLIHTSVAHHVQTSRCQH